MSGEERREREGVPVGFVAVGSVPLITGRELTGCGGGNSGLGEWSLRTWVPKLFTGVKVVLDTVATTEVSESKAECFSAVGHIAFAFRSTEILDR